MVWLKSILFSSVVAGVMQSGPRWGYRQGGSTQAASLNQRDFLNFLNVKTNS